MIEFERRDGGGGGGGDRFIGTCMGGGLRAECGQIMVGSGTDTYDPVCELPEGHRGPCKSSAAVDQHRLPTREQEDTAQQVIDSLHELTDLCASADTCAARAVIAPLVAENTRLREALRGLANAYGCFAGCTGSFRTVNEPDGSHHTPACRVAKEALRRA